MRKSWWLVGPFPPASTAGSPSPRVSACLFIYIHEPWRPPRRPTLPSTGPWQAALIGRIVDEIDRFNAERISLPKLVENSRGLFEAADISENETRMAFDWVGDAGEPQSIL